MFQVLLTPSRPVYSELYIWKVHGTGVAMELLTLMFREAVYLQAVMRK